MRWIGPVTVLLAIAACLAGGASARAAGITNSGDDLRTGWYPDQPALSPQVVSGGDFGQLWSTNVTGQVYAQPLLADGTVLVGTEANHVYGLDPADGGVRWHRSLGVPWNPRDLACEDLTPAIGITATPVVDPATHTAYLTSKTYVSGTSGPARWYLHAMDVTTGVERAGFPVELRGSAQNAPGQTFDPTHELQRPGLLLLDGVVYAAFGSHCDAAPWQGWIFGVTAAGTTTARWVAVDSGSGAGIWHSGAGLVSDGPGTIVVGTGNPGAPTSPAPGTAPPAKLGESIVRLRVQPDKSLRAVDFFAPADAAQLDTWDADFASGGPVGLPAASFGTAATPHLAVAVGKQGYVYLLDRDHLGGMGQGPDGDDDVVQRIGPYGGVWSRPGVWPGDGGYVYIPTASGGTTAGGTNGFLRVYRYGTSGSGSPTLSLVATSPDAFGFSSSAPVITSDGTRSGSALVWVVKAPSGSGTGATLRAYDPVPVAGRPVLRWEAPIGTSAKFAMPGVGAGRIYVGTRDGTVLGFGSPVTPALTGASLSYPTTTVGDTSTQTLTLRANDAVTVSSITSSSGAYRVGTPSRGLPATLPAGATLTVPVTFAPPGSGLFGATITVHTNRGDTLIGATGTGQATTAELSVTPPAVSFGGVAVGRSSTGSVTFRNTGAQPLHIDHVHAVPAPFELVDAPADGDTIAPGDALSVGVTFAPTQPGQYTGELVVDTNAGQGTVGLTGSSGTPGRLEISAARVDFGAVRLGTAATRSVSITNRGGTAVALTRSKPPSGNGFSLTEELPEGTTIGPGETVTRTLRYAPTRLGRETAGWSLNGTDDSGIHDIVLTGTGVAGSLTPAPLPPVGIPPAVTPPAAGPLAWWSFAERSGRRTADASGHGNTATIEGAHRTRAGRHGGAVRFRRAGDRVRIPHRRALALSRAMTIEAWVRPRRATRTAQPVVRGMRIGLDAGRPAASVGGARARAGRAALPARRWTHLAATWDGAVLRLYRDGHRVASRRAGGSLTRATGSLRIGGGAFRGLIDEVRVYGRALSAAQIAADMRAPGARR